MVFLKDLSSMTTFNRNGSVPLLRQSLLFKLVSPSITLKTKQGRDLGYRWMYDSLQAPCSHPRVKQTIIYFSKWWGAWQKYNIHNFIWKVFNNLCTVRKWWRFQSLRGKTGLVFVPPNYWVMFAPRRYNRNREECFPSLPSCYQQMDPMPCWDREQSSVP